MEINFFLDNQQIEFEKLVIDVGVEIENIEDFDDESSRRSSSLADINDSLIDDDDDAGDLVDEVEGGLTSIKEQNDKENNDSVDGKKKT